MHTVQLPALERANPASALAADGQLRAIHHHALDATRHPDHTNHDDMHTLFEETTTIEFRRPFMPTLRSGLAPLFTIAAVLVSACSGVSSDRKSAAASADSGFRGVVTAPAREKPDFTFVDQNGVPFNFRLATAGKVTLLFFGYTHCPDICPVHVANIAAVLRKLPPETRDAIRLVFVTTDPARDTAARLKEWLGQFDPSFIGLRATQEEVNRILLILQMPPIQHDTQPMGAPDYAVGHTAQVLAFGLDGYSHLEYPFGIRQDDWAHDLPKLARGDRPDGATSLATDVLDPMSAGARSVSSVTATPSPHSARAASNVDVDGTPATIRNRYVSARKRTRSMVCPSSVELNGFGITAATEANDSAAGSSASAFPVIRITGSDGRRLRMRRASSTPPSPGIVKSERSRS